MNPETLWKQKKKVMAAKYQQYLPYLNAALSWIRLVETSICSMMATRVEQITRTRETSKVNSTNKSKRFTVLGLSTLQKDPLMCIVIIEGKERKGKEPFH